MPAPCKCWMPESVCLSMILGNARGLSLSPSSNSSGCICFTDPCGSRRKPSVDKRNIVSVPLTFSGSETERPVRNKKMSSSARVNPSLGVSVYRQEASNY